MSTGDFQFDELFLSSSPQHSGLASKLDQEDEVEVDYDSDVEDFKGCDTKLSNKDEKDGHPDEAAEAAHIAIIPSINASAFTLCKVVGKGAYGKVRQVIKNDTKEILAMKTLRKSHLSKTKCVGNTIAEKDILRKVRHPFIVRLHYAFQTPGKVYLIMDFINGGHLLHHLRSKTLFSESQARFYLAEVILAIEHLHGLDIVHRDLKPENVLIGADGHIVLTDFGFAKEHVTDPESCKSICGTLEYMAPELVKKNRYGKAADWWSVGILLYDMLCGRPPFQHPNDQKLYNIILSQQLIIPKFISKHCATLIQGLLNRDVAKRFGVNEIKAHPFFNGIDWEKLANKEIEPPFLPEIEDSMDVSNFDKKFLKMGAGESPASHTPLSTSVQDAFKGFSYSRSMSVRQG